ncbi:MAG: nucleotide exchange factor GrpE [Candidatus Lokiarchaeota archaeon]|nr:nucleotide exchange factor GrpE [Candidatus Lokiarchaeota archaeon]
MVFGNKVFENMHPQNKEKNQISLEEYQTLKEKAQKYEELKKENEELKREKEELQNELEGVKQNAEQLKEKSETYLRKAQRLQADYENYKKRVDRDSANYKRFATEKIARKLISHYDDLRRAQEVIDTLEDDSSVKKGFQMIVKNFEKILEEEEIKPMDCEGEKFDPYKHDAMLVREDNETPENTVLEELEKGYFFKNEVLRPARVVVSKKSC